MDSDARSARIASSARSPRPSKAAPSRSNSSAERAHPDAQDQPAATEEVERSVPLGDLQRMVVAEHDHRRRQTNPAGVGGQKPEGGQRIPVGEPALVAFGDGHRDVLGAGEVVEAQFVGGPGDPGQVGDCGVRSHADETPGSCITSGVDSPIRTMLF